MSIREYFSRLGKAKFTLGQLLEARNLAALPVLFSLAWLYEYYKRDIKPIGPGDDKIPVQSWDRYVKEQTRLGKEI